MRASDVAGDAYGRDVLAAGRRAVRPPREVPARPGLTVQHRASGFTGAVVGLEAGAVTLRDARGRERVFPLHPGVFAVDGHPVTLVRAPAPVRPGGLERTASGSVAADPAPAKVARASRILVEGLHDAELLEKVWGSDLREEAIVVEVLDGVDDLAGVVRRFAPGPDRRLGVLVDHLVTGSKESRIAAQVAGPHVLVTGHPYVDIWQAVRPASLGLRAWPTVPPGRPWKEGICQALGVSEPALLWRRILARVGDYTDLEQPLVGAVEQLLDFLTDPARQR